MNLLCKNQYGVDFSPFFRASKNKQTKPIHYIKTLDVKSGSSGLLMYPLMLSFYMRMSSYIFILNWVVWGIFV